jgi:hypothetical protein
MKKKIVAVLASALVGIAGSAGAQTFVSADVTANTTWGGGANPSPIILQNPIFVKNGATLTILPGTIVRGQPRTAAVLAGSTVGTPGAVIVTQAGRIVANGSPASPVIFTTAATDNDNDGVADDADSNGFKDEYDAGDIFLDDTPTTAPLAPLNKAGKSNVSLWGGLVVLGSAPTNNAAKGGVGYGKVTIEGLTIPGFPAADATYGGIEPHDNSGLLRYVSIRHAGDEIGDGNELNGLSMGGVGDGTTIENVEVYCNFDDGFEWFGGTVNGKNLAVFFVGDDMFDLDEGYTGINQFLFGVMPFFNENAGTAYGSASGDKAGEFDGDNYRPDNISLNDNVNTRIDVTNSVVDPTPWPLSNPAMYNMTLIGSTPDAGQTFVPTSAAATNRGIQFRNGFAGAVHNSIVVNTGAETGIEVGSGTGAPGFGVIDNANAGRLSLVCSTLDDGAALAADEITVVNNGNALNLALGGTAAGANATTGAFTGLSVEDQTFNPTGNAAGKLDASLKALKLNPRPAGGLTGVSGCTSPRGPGLDPGATYRGAFLGTAPKLWTTGWTSLSVGGLLAN